MGSVLIIDDDEVICEPLRKLVEELGHEATYVLTLEKGLNEARSRDYDVIFLDVRMPDGNGLDYLPFIRKVPSSPEVIIMTAAGDPDGAELAIKSGAWDYIEKPFSIKGMTLHLIRAMQYQQEKKKVKKLPVVLKRNGIAGNGPGITACLHFVAVAAKTDSNVLITGETGTGKELFAEAIHQNSLRAAQSFVVVDCAALTESLVESVLFGHERGVFTGADKAREGLIKQAHQGTLFLDEVGELPLSVQKAFLRVLHERRFRPIGSKAEEESDFRLVAATNRDLDEMVSRGRYRKDLLYRLRAFSIDLPPLRERREDIVELVMSYVTKCCEKSKTETKGFSPEFFEALNSYSWPGNVRELFNTMDQVLAVAQNHPILFPKHLPDKIRIAWRLASVGHEASAETESMRGAASQEKLVPWREFRDHAEVEYLERLMSAAQNDINEACRISKFSRARLYQLLKKHKRSPSQ